MKKKVLYEWNAPWSLCTARTLITRSLTTILLCIHMTYSEDLTAANRYSMGDFIWMQFCTTNSTDLRLISPAYTGKTKPYQIHQCAAINFDTKREETYSYSKWGVIWMWFGTRNAIKQRNQSKTLIFYRELEYSCTNNKILRALIPEEQAWSQ